MSHCLIVNLPKPSQPAGPIIIEPRKPWLRLDLRELLDYRDLIYLMVRRDFLARYRQTILGPLWHLLQPLITTVVFTLVFNQIGGMQTDGVPALLFYLCSLSLWNYLSQTFTATATTFTSQSNLYKKVYFPRLVPPVAASCTQLVPFTLQLFIFLAAWLIYQWMHFGSHMFTWAMLALPLFLIHAALLGLGLGLLFSSITAKYRDLANMVPFMVQIWMFLTPIIFPPSEVSEKWQWLVWANPAAPLIVNWRHACLGTTAAPWQATVFSVILALLVCLMGTMLFKRVERTFVDYV